MAQKIKLKFISDEVKSYFDSQIDGVESSVTALESSKADKSYTDQKDQELAQDITALEGVVQGNFDLQQSDIDGLRSDVDANSTAISTEEAARIAGDLDAKAYADQVSNTALSSANDYTLQVKGELETTFDQGLNGSLLINGTRGMEGNLIMGDTSGTMHKIVALGDGVDAKDAVNKSQLDAVEAGIQSQITNLISNTSPEALDSLSEIVTAFEAADSNLQGAITSLANSASTALDTEEAARIAADQALDSKIDQEILDRVSSDNSLSGRISPIEDLLDFEKAIIFNDNAQVYADAQAGVEDANHRSGWYYKNTVAGQKINWYFYDGINQANITLGNFSAYAVMTFDSVSPVKSPIMAVYTVPTGTNDVMPSFAHSRIVYNGFSTTPVAGKKYLVYFGQNPAIHPELPRLQLNISSSNSVGEKNPNERVLTTSFGSNSGDAVNTVQFMVESLGVSSPSFKSQIELKIKTASMAKHTALETRVASLESAVDGPAFSNGSTVIGAELTHLDLDKQYIKLMSVAVGRMAVHEGEDFTVSVVGGKTRLTWIGSLVSPTGSEAIETGDKVFWVGAY